MYFIFKNMYKFPWNFTKQTNHVYGTYSYNTFKEWI